MRLYLQMTPFKDPNAWLEIDKNALDHNIAQYRKIVGPKQIALVIKGNAYGHGVKEIVHLTEHNEHINWYCTFSLSEALALRALNVIKPILVLGLIDQDPGLAILKDIDLVLFDESQLPLIMQRAKELNKTARLHIKIDTGLSRFGFLPHEALSIIIRLTQQKTISLQGIYTHFAATEQDDQSYTQWQSDQFHELLIKLNKCNIKIPYVHTQATAATIRHDDYLCNMVRIGAGAYGLYPSYKIKEELWQKHRLSLQQISTWKSYIYALRTIPKGTFIGYGCTYQTTADTKIAIIPVGYADGYDRRLSNIGKVLINNQYAPIVGRVAMNTITADITNISAAETRSEVILMGNYPDLTALDIAEQITAHNPREVIVRIAESVTRRPITPSLAIEHNSQNRAINPLS
jgi:alanine racemase